MQRNKTTHGRWIVTLLLALAVTGCEGSILDPGGGGGSGPENPGLDPGRITLHRLNRAEYNNTVRDLFGTQQRPADEFPFDDIGYGFDNIADVLSVSPTQVELYARAAESLVAEALEPGTGAAAQRFEAETIGGPNGSVHDGSAWRLTSNGSFDTTITLDDDGDYRLSARAWGDQAGPEPARMTFTVGGVTETFDVTATEAAPEVYSATVALTAGTHAVSVAFVNDYYNPDAGEDRNLAVDYFEVEGPLGTTGENPLRDRIVLCDPADSSDDDCTRTIVRAFGKRAWRRPLTDAEVDALATQAADARAAGDSFDDSLATVLESILLSPHFIFRVEIDPDPTSTNPHPVSDYEMASRLSYFLWSSMPDDELFAMADAGMLQDRGAIEQQVHRMLSDPKAAALIDNFAAQWLFLRGLQEHEPDYAVFPEWDIDLQQAMRRETELFFEAFLYDDIGLDQLFTADFTFVNARLAEHYGLPYDSDGEEFQRVTLPDDAHRAGLLTQGAILTVTSYPNRTSPVKRGKWVLEQLLCDVPPPPPPGVEGLPEGENGSGPIKEQMERHRTDPVCASCHVQMDAIGFGLEHFDAIGRYRTMDREYPVDATGELDGIAFDGARELAQVLADDPRFARCAVEKMYVYALGRGPEGYDEPHLDRLAEKFADNGYRLSDLIVSIATSDPFRFRRGEPAQGGK